MGAFTSARATAKRAVDQFVEALQRLVGVGVDTAQRPAIGQIPLRVQPGDERLAVGAPGLPLPGGLLGEQRTRVHVAHELGQREQPRLGHGPSSLVQAVIAASRSSMRSGTNRVVSRQSSETDTASRMRANSVSCARVCSMPRRTSRQRMLSGPSQMVFTCASRKSLATGQVSI